MTVALNETGHGRPRDAVPLVSVVIPVYNRTEFLRQAIESALTQTYANVEVVVVDDGSSVDVPAQISGLRNKVAFHRIPNGGPAAARNHGFRNATGQYVLFLDDDDYLHPDGLRSLVDAAEAPPQWAWVAANCAHVDRNGHPIRIKACDTETGDAYRRLILRNFVGTPASVLVSSAALRGIGGFDDDRRVQFCEDYDLWLKLARRHPLKVIPDVVASYRLYEGNATRDQRRHLEAWLCVLDKQRRDAAPDCRELFDAAVGAIHREYGDLLYVHGSDRAAARAHWIRAARAGELGRWAHAWRLLKSHMPAPILRSFRRVHAQH